MKVSLDGLLVPTKIDRHGPLYKVEDVKGAVLNLIKTNCYFKLGAKKMSEDLQQATEILEKANSNYATVLNKFMGTTQKLHQEADKASQSVRQSTEKLSQGLARIEKQANFQNLERYVELLERAASAMSILSELEKSGKLDKIAAAIK